MEPSEKFFEKEKFIFQRKNSNIILDHDVPLALVLNLDQTPFSYISPEKYTFSSKGSKNVPIKGLDDKRQITATFVVSATGSFLPIQLIYQGKSKRCLPKFTFPSNFHVTFTPNHWSNLEKCEDLFKVIIFPYFSTKKKELGYPEDQRSLIIVDTFKGQGNEEMKRLCAKNNCDLIIIPHNLTNKFQPLDISINQSARNLSQTNSTHGMLIELANNYQMELHLAMLKYPSNWVIWNLFMLGGLLRHTIISNTKMIPLSKVSMLQGSARLSHVQTMSSHG